MNKYFLTVLLILALFFSGTRVSAQTADDDSRNSNIDEGMLYTWLRYGGPIPDDLLKALKFRGTGHTVTPSNFYNIVSAIAAQWVFGVSPKGVNNYSSDLVTERKNNNAYDEDEEKLLRSVAEVALGVVPMTNGEKLESNDPVKQGKITKLSGKGSLTSIALSDANSTGVFANLWSAALGRANNIAATAPDLNGMLPEQENSREIGQGMSNPSNSNINADERYYVQNSSNSRVAGTETTRLVDENGRVLQAATGTSGKDSPYKVLVGGISVSQGTQAARDALRVNIPALTVISQPKAINDQPVNAIIPSSIYGADAQKGVTSASVRGNARLLGTNNEVAGFTNKLPGASLGNIQDAMKIAAQNASNQINNRIGQLNNLQNRFPGGRLNNLQNQFQPNQFNNQLNNRFPGGGSGGSGGGGGAGPSVPNISPSHPDTATCNPENATLEQQEVIDIADFLGLPLETSQWNLSYFKGAQLLNTQATAVMSNQTFTFDSSIIPDGNACLWVVYAQDENVGAFVPDTRSQNTFKFLFSLE